MALLVSVLLAIVLPAAGMASVPLSVTCSDLNAEAGRPAENSGVANALVPEAPPAAGLPLAAAPLISAPKDADEPAGTVVLGFLRNYEVIKLYIRHPEVHQAVLAALFGFLVWISIRKSDPTPLLDRQQTEQLKGLGIFLVVFSHLWVHVSQDRPLLVLGEDGVTLFLLLSGFGLAASSGNRRPNAKAFVTRRLMRVMLPYWCATVVVIALDAVILGRILPSTDLALTLIGINVSGPTRSLDFVRWFVTFILLWYALFYLAMLLKDKAGLNPLILLFSCGLVFFLFDYYVYGFAYQEFAFPVGCALARYRDEIRSCFERARGRWVVSAVALLAVGVLYKALMPVLYPALWPMLFFRFSFQAASIAVAAGLIILLGRLGASGQSSRTLALLGVLSYEVFLLHGPLLIKYNPVFGLLPVMLLPLSFMLLLGILLILSAGIHRVRAAYDRPR